MEERTRSISLMRALSSLKRVTATILCQINSSAAKLRVLISIVASPNDISRFICSASHPRSLSTLPISTLASSPSKCLRPLIENVISPPVCLISEFSLFFCDSLVDSFLIWLRHRSVWSVEALTADRTHLCWKSTSALIAEVLLVLEHKCVVVDS